MNSTLAHRLVPFIALVGIACGGSDKPAPEGAPQAAASKSAALPPSMPLNRTVTGSEGGSTITLKSGDTLTIRLSANATTGFNWTVAKVDQAVLRPIGPVLYQPQETPDHKRVGIGGFSAAKFLAGKAGTTSLELSYQRPDDKTPQRKFEVTVVVR